MAAALGVVRSLSYITPDEGNQLLGFDSAIHIIQSRLPVLLAALALMRDTFADTGIKCKPPEYVTNSETAKYFNSYCKYRENENLIGYHEFVPFSFTLQAILVQIPVSAWIACGGRKISMVALWFAKCCREMCLEAEASKRTDDKVSTTESTDWPKVHSIIQSYVNEWSASRSYLLTYFFFKVLLYLFICVSWVYHFVQLSHTIEPHFLNNEFLCEIEQTNETIKCVKTYEIFNQILVIIDLMICLTVPLLLMCIRDTHVFLSMYYGWQGNITEFIPFLKIPGKSIRLNNTQLLILYYKENIGLDEKYVQKILIPWRFSNVKSDEYSSSRTRYL
ncbi:uncharacterized protein LOC117124794 isoform X1 [Anneissia japonica]|uniref:uncharacterized protein LOC117124794 isoform X1 n=1 Tax=Anneissia japonica TaxID=1529436 RepID=UPI0014257A3B|nr:uncharacterized protein LOC117124794 isoform X1 [Anneissia japonica]XP_033127016.1 uncharacterized protein LOC117124794 isoform X1 [Anneissia japonica]